MPTAGQSAGVCFSWVIVLYITTTRAIPIAEQVVACIHRSRFQGGVLVWGILYKTERGQWYARFRCPA